MIPLRRIRLGRILLPALLVSAGPTFLEGQSSATLPCRDSTRTIDDRVRDLLARMTLAEKFWQLYMSPGSLDDPAHDYSSGAFGLQVKPTDTTGAAARQHAERINRIQRYFVERTRLGIPIISFEEGVHGLPLP